MSTPLSAARLQGLRWGQANASFLSSPSSEILRLCQAGSWMALGSADLHVSTSSSFSTSSLPGPLPVTPQCSQLQQVQPHAVSGSDLARQSSNFSTFSTTSSTGYGRSTSTSSSFATTSSSNINPSTTINSSSIKSWRQATNPTFAIRPSFLSPLFSSYQRETEAEERRQLLLNLLRAHSILASDVDGLDEVQIGRSTRYRIAQLRDLTSDLNSLLAPGSAPTLPPTCTNAAQMYGYMDLLEQTAARANISASEFRQVQEGGTEVLQHWLDHFVRKYRGSPGLESLDAIFRRKDPAAELSKLAASLDASRTGNAGEAAAAAERKRRHGANVDLAGTCSAVGKRKSATARVLLTDGGCGRVIVNGVPYDEYFQDVHVRAAVLVPFFQSSTMGRFDVSVQVRVLELRNLEGFSGFYAVDYCLCG